MLTHIILPNPLRVFICSDFGLSDGEILSHYTHRWKIEVMFKLQKNVYRPQILYGAFRKSR